MSAYVSMRQHTQHTSEYVSIRQYTSAYVSKIRQHTSAYVSIRQHTSAYLSALRKGSVWVVAPVNDPRQSPTNTIDLLLSALAESKRLVSWQCMRP
jgi:hypothetical protein